MSQASYLCVSSSTVVHFISFTRTSLKVTSTYLSLSLGPYPVSWILQPSLRREGSFRCVCRRLFRNIISFEFILILYVHPLIAYIRIKVFFPPIRYGLGPHRACLYVTAGTNCGTSEYAMEVSTYSLKLNSPAHFTVKRFEATSAYQTRRIKLRGTVPSTEEESQLWKLISVVT